MGGESMLFGMESLIVRHVSIVSVRFPLEMMQEHLVCLVVTDS